MSNRQKGLSFHSHRQPKLLVSEEKAKQGVFSSQVRKTQIACCNRYPEAKAIRRPKKQTIPKLTLRSYITSYITRKQQPAGCKEAGWLLGQGHVRGHLDALNRPTKRRTRRNATLFFGWGLYSASRFTMMNMRHLQNRCAAAGQAIG